MFSQRLSVFVRRSNTIPISEVQMPSNVSVALNLCRVAQSGKKTRQAPNRATLQHDSCIRTNRALFVRIFEGGLIRYSTACLSIFVVSGNLLYRGHDN